MLRRDLKKLECRKEKLIKHLESKEYSKFLDQLDKLDVANRASLFYKEFFKSFKSKSSNIAGVIKNKSGEFSKCEKEFLDNWRDFYAELFSNDPQISEENHSKNVKNPPVPSLDSPPEFEEFHNILFSLPKNKAPGLDELRVEEFLYLSEEALHILHKIIVIFWKLKSVPPTLKICILVPLLKDVNGDIHDCRNYRPIALMSNLLKLYQSILNARLIEFLEKTKYFHDEQHGFRKMRSIEDCHLLLKEIVNSYKYKKGPRGGTAGPRSL